MIDFFKKMFSSEGKVKDPICGMTVDVASAKYKSTHEGKDYHFCSEHCKKQFEDNPKEYSG